MCGFQYGREKEEEKRNSLRNNIPTIIVSDFVLKEKERPSVQVIRNLFPINKGIERVWSERVEKVGGIFKQIRSIAKSAVTPARSNRLHSSRIRAVLAEIAERNNFPREKRK